MSVCLAIWPRPPPAPGMPLRNKNKERNKDKATPLPVRPECLRDTEDKGTKHKHKAKTKAGAGHTPRANGSALHLGPIPPAYARPTKTKRQAKTNKATTKDLALGFILLFIVVRLVQATEKQTG
jgi:hypothetical protein